MFLKIVPGLVLGTRLCAQRFSLGQHDLGDVMWDNLMTLVVAAVLIPTIVVLGLFRLAALKRADDLPAHVAEWARQQDRKDADISILS